MSTLLLARTSALSASLSQLEGSHSARFKTLLKGTWALLGKNKIPQPTGGHPP